MKTVILIPTYNEAPNLERLVLAIRRISPQSVILVVDDQSPDGTGDIADRLADADPYLRVLHRDPPRGRGVAGRDGYVEALRLGADIVLEMDADFSHDPRLLPRFWDEIARGADVVLGSRFVTGGSDHDRGIARRAITWLANGYIRTVLGVPVGDCNSGYRCFRRGMLEAISVESLRSPGPSIVQEVLFRVHRAGAKVVEIPLAFVDRKDGDSKLGLGLLLDGYFMILKLKLGALLERER